MDRLARRPVDSVMNMSPVVILTSIAAIASAAAAGMMYVFSTFVMRGLDRTGPVNAITAMRGINVEANANAPFLLAYLGAALLAVGGRCGGRRSRFGSRAADGCWPARSSVCSAQSSRSRSTCR